MTYYLQIQFYKQKKKLMDVGKLKNSHIIYLEQELKSLQAVLDIKNKQLHRLCSHFTEKEVTAYLLGMTTPEGMEDLFKQTYSGTACSVHSSKCLEREKEQLCTTL